MSDIVTSGGQPATSMAVIAEGLQDFGIETDLTAEELFEVATHALSASVYQAVKAGVAYMAAQAALKISDSDMSESKTSDCDMSQSGTFISWIKARGLTERRVYEVIKIAKGYLAIPAAQRKSYLALGKYKALKLASIEPEALAELAEKDPEALDGMALMSRDEMSRTMANLRAQLEIEQGKTKRLTESQTKQRLTQFEPRTEDVRAECMALQLESELPLNALHKLFEEELHNFSGTPESTLRLEQIWVVAHNAVATALDVLGKLQALNAAAFLELPERQMGQHILTLEEAERWLLDKPLLENRYNTQRALREDKRNQDKPRGRGRPTGSKNRAAGE